MEGNSYTPEVKLAARTLQPEIPVKATFTIQNVPANVTGFSYIKIPLRINTILRCVISTSSKEDIIRESMIW